MFMRLFSLAVVFSLLTTGCAEFAGRLPGATLNARAPEIEWTKGYGTAHEDVAREGRQTADGGYIVVGMGGRSSNNEDIMLVKTDAQGNETWRKFFGGSYKDFGESVWQTTDGGYVLAGMRRTSRKNEDVYLVKTDGNGNLQWEKTFGGSGDDHGWCVQQTSDGGYIVSGHTNSSGAGSFDVYLIKTDSAGNVQWDHTYGSALEERGWFVREDPANGGYIVCGVAWIETPVEKKDDIYLIKVDTDGKLEWEKNYGGKLGEHGWCVQPTSDGGYIVAGHSESHGNGGWDFYLLKTDSNGNMQWQNNYGQPGLIYDEAWGVQQTSDGGYILAGGTGIEPGMLPGKDEGVWSVYVVKTDSVGNMQWDLTYGNTSHNAAEFIALTDDGGYIVIVDSDGYGSEEAPNFALTKLGPESSSSDHYTLTNKYQRPR